MEVIKILGKNIKNKRIQKQLSQEAFADLCGLHRTYIGMIERGEKNLTFVNLVKVSKALDVSICELVQGIE
jgi:transcriptional regulator with XRE-family HTH domain